MKGTIKNKLIAMVFVLAGCLPVMLDGDATLLIFLSFVALPLFFAKRNWIV